MIREDTRELWRIAKNLKGGNPDGLYRVLKMATTAGERVAKATCNLRLLRNMRAKNEVTDNARKFEERQRGGRGTINKKLLKQIMKVIYCLELHNI